MKAQIKSIVILSFLILTYACSSTQPKSGTERTQSSRLVKLNENYSISIPIDFEMISNEDNPEEYELANSEISLSLSLDDCLYFKSMAESKTPGTLFQLIINDSTCLQQIDTFSVSGNKSATLSFYQMKATCNTILEGEPRVYGTFCKGSYKNENELAIILEIYKSFKFEKH